MVWTSATSNLRCSPDAELGKGWLRAWTGCRARCNATSIDAFANLWLREWRGAADQQPVLQSRIRTRSRHVTCVCAAKSFRPAGQDRTSRSSVSSGDPAMACAKESRMTASGSASFRVKARRRRPACQGQLPHCRSPLQSVRRETLPRPERSQATRRRDRDRTLDQSISSISHHNPRTSFSPSSTCLMTAPET